MGRKIEALGNVLQQVIKELEFMKTMVVGDHRVIKELEEFPAIIKMLQDEQEKNTAGAPTGDDSSINADGKSGSLPDPTA